MIYIYLKEGSNRSKPSTRSAIPERSGLLELNAKNSRIVKAFRIKLRFDFGNSLHLTSSKLFNNIISLLIK